MLEARRLLADALQIPIEEIADDASINTVERWDSLAHMRVILALENTVGHPLDTTVMLTIDSVATINAILKSE